MGLGTFISAITSMASAIVSTVSSIGRAVSSFATTVAPVIGKVVDTLKPFAQVLGQFASSFLQALGVIPPHQKVEDLGERALQGAEQGITLDRFENFDEYMEALRDFDLDEDVSDKRSQAEKLVAGLAVGTVAVEKKYDLTQGSLNGMWLLPLTNPTYFTPERMQALVASGRLGGDVFAYLENRLSAGQARDFEKKLEPTSTGQTPDDGELGSLYGALDSAQEKWADIAKQLDDRDKAERRDA